MAPETISVVYADPSRRDKRMRDMREKLLAAGVRVMNADAKRLDGMASGVPHQGIVALAEETHVELDFADLLDQITDKTLLLILDGVTDPRNFGACLRTADAAGVQAVVVPRDRSAGMTPAAMKAAAGAAETVPVVTVTNLAWVLGAEGDGLRQLTRKRCDDLAAIPMTGAVESLNVSVAAGICLFESVRQRLAAK